MSADQTPIDPAAPRIFDPSSGPPPGTIRMMPKQSPTALTIVMTGNAVRMNTLMNRLQSFLDRPQIDKNALAGLYDV